MASDSGLRRRELLWASLAAAGGTAAAVTAAWGQGTHAGHKAAPVQQDGPAYGGAHSAHGDMLTVGNVDEAANGFSSLQLLTEWETGTVSTLPDRGTLRSFSIEAVDREIEIAPGVMFPAWTYNGRVPGPAIRAKEGERLRITFKNFGSHPHSMHFHGMHAARMDGIPGAGLINPGEEFVYEFDAYPFGCHLPLPCAAAATAHA